MSEESKDFELEESQALGLKEAQKLTVGEAVRKDYELKAGITKDDSILDKYIKQHRDEVSSQKFDTKYLDLDTATLDNFIKKQREELAKSGLVTSDEVILDEDQDVPQEPALDTEDLTETVVATDLPIQEEPVIIPEMVHQAETQELDEDDNSGLLGSSRKDYHRKTPKKGLLLVLLGVLVIILVLVYYKSHSASSNKQIEKPSQSLSTQKSKTAKKDAKLKAEVKDFNEKYQAFYTDATKTKLKNSEFAKLPELETALKALKGSAYYPKAKEQFDTLKKQVTAIQAVNEQFVTGVIVDGEKVAADVKPGANFDQLDSSTLSTGSASLDSLLQSSITEGRKQLTDRAAQPSKEQQTPQAQAPQVSPAPSEPVSPVVGYGITNYDPSTLQRDLSRVPYHQGMIADKGNPAWAFNPGVLEKIVATSQARGYISGNLYILEPVNIINGNGYYNMFKPDGTYLFSINCKTGYFVGNARGHSDALDY
ncbi:cell division site-positioning protein MapZ family protein [Streptococcus phocae]|uniref:Mid-cell-anchored protein Z n=1 Tax=Streptococcus phocae TaxID=119224 RepID=A0A0N8FXA1_9STRE|nr:cell division site-positioning protein MapZ family protein [Streptococcus phocae]KPJ22555.1 hypothetical protein AKK44_04025 [Streptococcus phocae]